MKKRISEKEWFEEFKDFIAGGEGVAVPEEVSNRILEHVHRSLNPPPWLVFLKVLAVHSIVGTLSLAVCDQFGINPFNTSFSLSDYFMKFGHSVCMTLCGVLFISLTILGARVFLRKEELTVLKKNAFVQVPVLSGLSLGVFMIFGADIALSIAFLWLCGGIIGGVLAAQLVNLRGVHA